MRVIRSSLILVALAALLAGCGFHLRGQRAAAGVEDLGALHVRASAALVEALRSEVAGSGGRLVEDAGEADVRIVVAGEAFSRRVLSVDPQSGKASEYQLRYRLSFAASGRDGRSIVASEPLELARDFVFDRGALIGKGREEGRLREELRREAARRILRRVSAAR